MPVNCWVSSLRTTDTMKKLVDVNTSLGVWPFQRFAIDSARELADHQEAQGISASLVSHLGTVFYPDPNVYNLELIDALAPHDELHAVPVINPHLNRWEDDFERYFDQADIKAVKFMPSFHNYRIYSKPVFKLIEEASVRGARVLLQMRYEDERDRYFALNIDGPKTTQVLKLARRFPDTDLVALNCYLPEVKEMGPEADNLLFDIAFAEWMYTMGEMRSVVPVDRIFFGSHTPMLTTRSAVMKLMDSTLEDQEKDAIGRENAMRFFKL